MKSEIQSPTPQPNYKDRMPIARTRRSSFGFCALGLLRISDSGIRVCALLMLGWPLLLSGGDLRAEESLSRVWREDSCGISLQLPPDATYKESTVGGMLLRLTGSGGERDYVITISIKHNPEMLSIEEVVNLAINEVAMAQPSAAIVSQEIAPINERDAALIYFRIPDRVNERAAVLNHIENFFRTPDRSRVSATTPGGPIRPWLFALGTVQINLNTLVHFQMEVDQEYYDTAQTTFEALIRSMQVEDPQKLLEQRMELIANFQKWREQVTPAKLNAACIDEQFFRIVEKNQDIGYMRVQQRRTTEANVTGIRIDVQARVTSGQRAIDTLSHFFLSDDGESEIWSTRVTERPINAKSALATDARLAHLQELSTVETGVRSGTHIEVTQQSATGIKHYAWEKPGDAYLSQVEVLLLGRLLAATPAEAIGFYAYNPGDSRITFRSERVQRTNTGLRIFSRPNPEKPGYHTDYDLAGFLRSQLAPGEAGKPGTRAMLPTTRLELAAKWQLR